MRALSRLAMPCLWAVVLVAPLAAQAAQPANVPDDVARQRAGNALALYSKLLCSGVFVCEREPQNFIDNDLQRAADGLPEWSEIDVDVNSASRTVALRFKPGSRWSDLPARTSVFVNACQGCTLLPLGAQKVFFEPVEFESALPDASTLAWPLGDALSDDPLPAEVDEQALTNALEFAFDDARQSAPQKTRAVVVLYKGRLIAERYAPGFDQHSRHISWSMGKSITAALVGLIVRDGHVRVDEPAPVAEWQRPDDPRRSITIADLLHMSSGLRFERGTADNGLYFTDRDNHTAVYFGAVNVFDYSARRELEHPPNTVWRYRNCDPLILGKIVREQVESHGGEYLSFPQRELFDKIGARDFVLEVDAWGNFIMTGFDYGTARDWARFGLLHLNDGVFAGQRILPEGWVDFVRQPAPASTARDYGALFWLNAGGDFPNVPRDMYAPNGHHGQTVLIIPSREIVIVRLGHSTTGGFESYMRQLAGMILDSVKAPQ